MSEQSPFLISTTNRPTTTVHDFVGRETEINPLVESLNPTDSNLASSGKVAVIYGEAGIGKTELAWLVAHRLRPQYPDAQLAVIFHNTGDSTLAVQHVLETVIHTFDPLARLPDNLNELQALYNSLLAGKKVLIIVDEVDSERAVDLLIPPPTCALLLTTSHQFKLSTAFNLELGQLSSTDAEQLLLTICPRIGPEAASLAQMCQYTPLALRLSASLLAYDLSFEVKDFIRVLTEQVEQTPDDQVYRKNLINKIIEQAYQRPDANSQQTFCKLGLFLAGFDQTAAMALTAAGSENEEIKRQLDTLCQLNLLGLDEATKFYRMHPSVRNFAVEHLADSLETHLQLANYYANTAEDCAALAYRDSDGLLLGLLIFDDHKIYIKQAWAWLEQQEQGSSVIDTLILRFYKIMDVFGRLRFFPKRELIPQIKTALAAAQRLNDQEATLSILGSLGRTYYVLRQGQKALEFYRQQLGLAQQQGNRSEETKIRHHISLVQATDQSP